MQPTPNNRHHRRADGSPSAQSASSDSPEDTSHLTLASIFGKAVYDIRPEAEVIDAEIHLASADFDRPRTVEELRADIDAGRDIAGLLVALPPDLAARLAAIPPDSDHEPALRDIAADLTIALRLPPTHQIIIHGKTIEIFHA